MQSFILFVYCVSVEDDVIPAVVVDIDNGVAVDSLVVFFCFFGKLLVDVVLGSLVRGAAVKNCHSYFRRCHVHSPLHIFL